MEVWRDLWPVKPTTTGFFKGLQCWHLCTAVRPKSLLDLRDIEYRQKRHVTCKHLTTQYKHLHRAPRLMDHVVRELVIWLMIRQCHSAVMRILRAPLRPVPPPPPATSLYTSLILYFPTRLRAKNSLKHVRMKFSMESNLLSPLSFYAVQEVMVSDASYTTRSSATNFLTFLLT